MDIVHPFIVFVATNLFDGYTETDRIWMYINVTKNVYVQRMYVPYRLKFARLKSARFGPKCA